MCSLYAVVTAICTCSFFNLYCFGDGLKGLVKQKCCVLCAHACACTVWLFFLTFMVSMVGRVFDRNMLYYVYKLYVL